MTILMSDICWGDIVVFDSNGYHTWWADITHCVIFYCNYYAFSLGSIPMHFPGTCLEGVFPRRTYVCVDAVEYFRMQALFNRTPPWCS